MILGAMLLSAAISGQLGSPGQYTSKSLCQLWAGAMCERARCAEGMHERCVEEGLRCQGLTGETIVSEERAAQVSRCARALLLSSCGDPTPAECDGVTEPVAEHGTALVAPAAQVDATPAPATVVAPVEPQTVAAPAPASAVPAVVPAVEPVAVEAAPAAPPPKPAQSGSTVSPAGGEGDEEGAGDEEYEETDEWEEEEAPSQEGQAN